MNNMELERLSRRLRRPLRSLAALRGFSAQELQELEQALDQAQGHQHTEISKALSRAFPVFLHRLLLGSVRWDSP